MQLYILIKIFKSLFQW